jgi:hypothetical protein
LDRGDAVIIESIDPPCSLRLFGHQSSFLQQAKMPRDGGSTDGQGIGNVSNRSPAVSEDLHNLAARGVT